MSSPLTDLDICNLGIGKVPGSLLTNIDPPKSPVERLCSRGYRAWRDAEFTKRRWVFSMERALLTQSVTPLPDVHQPYGFLAPANMLRPIRDKYSEWELRGQTFWNTGPTLVIEFIERKPEHLFHPLFIDVLSWRIALECAPTIANSSGQKISDLRAGYTDAVREAYRANAAIIGTENVEIADEHDSWLMGRWSYDVSE